MSDILKNSMTITWQPSYYDGDSPVTAYIIEKQDATLGLGSWMRVDKVKSHIYSFCVTHLLEGHRYLFRVIAENALGRSQPLESRNAVETKTPYGEFRCLLLLFIIHSFRADLYYSGSQRKISSNLDQQKV